MLIVRGAEERSHPAARPVRPTLLLERAKPLGSIVAADSDCDEFGRVRHPRSVISVLGGMDQRLAKADRFCAVRKQRINHALDLRFELNLWYGPSDEADTCSFLSRY